MTSWNNLNISNSASVLFFLHLMLDALHNITFWIYTGLGLAWRHYIVSLWSRNYGCCQHSPWLSVATFVYLCCCLICALLNSPYCISVISAVLSVYLLWPVSICCILYPAFSFILYLIGGYEGSNKTLTQRNQFFIGFKERIRLRFMCALLQFLAVEVLGFKRKFYGAVNSIQFSFPFHPHKLVTHQ